MGRSREMTDTNKLIDHLRKAQKHLLHAENRLGKAGLEAWAGPEGLWEKAFDWQGAIRSIRTALYQGAIKDLENPTNPLHRVMVCERRREMSWQGVVNIRAVLETEYEFGDMLLAETAEEAKSNALRMLHEDILQLSYSDPVDLWAWLQQSAQYDVRPEDEPPTAS